MALYLLIGAMILLAVYIRLAPTDPARWHVTVPYDEDADLRGGAVRVLDGGPEDLERIDAAALALPRTRRLAGGPHAGRTTYVTRSLVFGFPDYTTVELAEGEVRLWGRLRFGGSDLGVNARRLDRLIEGL